MVEMLVKHLCDSGTTDYCFKDGADAHMKQKHWYKQDLHYYWY